MNQAVAPPILDFDGRQALYETLLPPAKIIVRHGAYGKQWAQVVRRGVKHKRVRVWQAESKRWTKPHAFGPGEIIRRATADDFEFFKPDYGLPWERN